MNHRDDQPVGDEPPVVVRDRRRIDPETGAVRIPDAAASAAAASAQHAQPNSDGAPAPDATVALKSQLDERTNDLQRVSAEYANYRKRVERDREAVVMLAKAQVVGDLLGVLDDLERAEAHGDLTGVFKTVADKVAAALQKSGLQAFGHEGEAFDPALHEAVQHGTSPDVDGPTVTAVLRRGYTFGERVLRPAMVAVTDHEPAADRSAGSVGSVIEDALIEPEPPGAVARPGQPSGTSGN